MKKIIIFLLYATIITSCCKDHSDIIPGQDFIPDEVLQKIIDNGHPIYEGFNPPMLTGKYLLSPLVLVSSNFDDFATVGYLFNDEILEFKNFNSDELKLDVMFEQGNTMGFGEGSFVSGSGNNFTVYVKLEVTDNYDHTTINTHVYSGTLENGGIKDLSLSVFMIEDNGDPNEAYIENGQGRLVKDGDDFSPEI